jgi:hypothetical protein
MSPETCWYCQSSAQPDAVDDVGLFKDVQVTRDSYFTKNVKWTRLTVPVPRCRRCKGRHQLGERGSNLFTVLGILGGGAGGLFYNGSKGHLFSPIGDALVATGIGAGAGFLICGVLGLIFARVAVLGATRPQSSNLECPLIQARLTEGWKVGQPPDLA